MKELTLAIIIGLIGLSCLNPEHDNAYDPENPKKANLEGSVYFYYDEPIRDVRVCLLQDGEIIQEIKTDNDGDYGFFDIDPGFYAVSAHLGYFIPETLPAPLPADTQNMTDIFLQEILFDFERDPVGTSEPWVFRPLFGEWVIVDIPGEGHGYVGNAPTSETSVAIVDLGLKDFYYEAMVLIEPTSSVDFVSGIYFRYHDMQNHYGIMFFNDHIKLFRMFHGNWELIVEDWRPFVRGVWYTLAVDCGADHIQVYLNNNPLFDVFDNTFSDGKVGLFIENSAAAVFDDVYIDISDIR